MTDGSDILLATFHAVEIYDLDGNKVSPRDLNDSDIDILCDAFGLWLEGERDRPDAGQGRWLH